MYQKVTDTVLKECDALLKCLREIQHAGNNDIVYQTDLQTYGVSEKWNYPVEKGFRLVGDCEDIALYKRHLLVQKGVPSECLRMIICKDPNGAGHCVLGVSTDEHTYVLCNNHTDLTTVKRMRSEGYEFLYAQHPGSKLDEAWDVLAV